MPLDKGHITTRQNIQLHHIPLADAAELIREISDAGLSSREGCGNTVRNVTGDPWAGVAADELFDPTPYAVAYVRYFVRHPTTQLMPRKIKTAFTASDDDRAITGIHDIGFIPGRIDGRRQGLRDPRRRRHLDHAPGRPDPLRVRRADDGEYLKVTEAVLRIFDRQDWLRVNRARARIKVLVDKIGIDEFREHGRRGAQGRLGRRARLLASTACCSNHDEEATAPRRPGELRPPERRPVASSTRFCAANVAAAAPGGLLDRRR